MSTCFLFFTLKHLKLICCGMPSGNFVNNSDEGYRTLVSEQNQTKPKKSASRQIIQNYLYSYLTFNL